MKSLQNLYEQIGKITKDTTTDSVAQYKIWVNETHREVCALRSWKFLETTRTITTVASQEAYDLPENYRRVIDVYLTSGTTIYSPKPIIKEEDYKKLKSQNLGASDALQYYYIDQGQIRFLPAPATVSLSINLYFTIFSLKIIIFSKSPLNMSFAEFSANLPAENSEKVIKLRTNYLFQFSQ